MSDTRTSTRAAQPSAGAMRAAREVAWVTRHSDATDQNLVAEIVDRETGAEEMLSALKDAPEMDTWAIQTPEEQAETMGSYILWYHNQRERAIRRARGDV